MDEIKEGKASEDKAKAPSLDELVKQMARCCDGVAQVKRDRSAKGRERIVMTAVKNHIGNRHWFLGHAFQGELESWLKMKIPKDVVLKLDQFLIDFYQSADDVGTDKWCLDWFRKQFDFVEATGCFVYVGHEVPLVLESNKPKGMSEKDM